MKKILFVGDINVDVILGGMASHPVPNREIPCRSYTVTVGSSAVICASAFSFLGGKAAFAGLAGQDENGRYMLRAMRAFGLDTALVERTEAVATGVTVNLICGPIRSQVTYPGTIAAYTGAKLTPPVLRRFHHLHFAGPYQQTRFRHRITGLLRAARHAGLTTSLDPQWDPAERWKYMDQWLPLLTYFFPNGDEAMSITGAGSPAAACRRLAALTPCPVVKNGRRGVLACVAGKAVSVPPIRVRVKDTTGAGDNLNAAFLHGVLDRGMNVADAARFANAAGARSCMFTGGVTARSSYRDVMKFMQEHTVR